MHRPIRRRIHYPVSFLVFYISALLITFLLTRASNAIFRKMTGDKNAAILSFLVFAGLALLLGGTMILPLRIMLYFYIPSLILWLLIDLYRASNQTCPYCGKRIQKSLLSCRYCGRDIGTGATLRDDT